MNTDQAYANFSNKLTALIDQFAPEKTVTIPYKRIMREPWMTKGILKSSKHRDKLFQAKLRQPPDHHSHSKYTTYRNLFNKIKRASKQTYYENLLHMYKDDIKNTWKTVNSLLARTRNKTCVSDIFRYNDTTLSDPGHIANEFCKYFTNIGPEFASAIPEAHKPYDFYLNNRITKSIFLSPTDPDEIQKILMSLKPQKSCGHDDISSSFIRDINTHVSIPIRILVNKSLENGHVPDIMKIAKVIPVFKSKEQDLFSNYRPISLFPAISKTFFDNKIFFKWTSGNLFKSSKNN